MRVERQQNAGTIGNPDFLRLSEVGKVEPYPCKVASTVDDL